MTNCPECGSVVARSVGDEHARCLDSACGWEGSLDETIPETGSPLHVDTSQGEVVFEVRVRSGRRTETKRIRLSPHEARSFAMALEVAANDADRRSDRDGDDDGGGFGFDAPQPPAGGESRE